MFNILLFIKKYICLHKHRDGSKDSTNMKDVLEVVFVGVAGSSINGQPPTEEKL